MYVWVWASFVGSLYAVCLSSLCIAHEKTCLEFLFISLSLSLSPTLELLSLLLYHVGFTLPSFLGLPSHHLPPPLLVARFVLRLLYKLLMTAKPNRENERACSASRNYLRKSTLDDVRYTPPTNRYLKKKRSCSRNVYYRLCDTYKSKFSLLQMSI